MYLTANNRRALTEQGYTFTFDDVRGCICAYAPRNALLAPNYRFAMHRAPFRPRPVAPAPRRWHIVDIALIAANVVVWGGALAPLFA